jgi:glycosyltransferase involved in cell wall biosynthesis
MPTSPRCSIVMPAFNVEAYISEAVQSVLAQSVTDWELLVVDDGSSDGTVQAVQAFQDPRLLLIQQAHAGVGAARNQGIAESSSDIIVFLDADDRLRPGALAQLMGALAQTSLACLAYGEGVVMNTAGQVFGAASGPLLARRPSGWVLRDILQSNFILTGGVCVRMDCLRKVGYFQTSLLQGQDWELWCRLATVGEFLYIGREPVVEYRLRPGSISRTLGRTPEKALCSVKAVFTNPEIRCWFEPGELAQLQRKREAAVYATAGTECLKTRSWVQARALFFESLRHDCLRPRELVLLGVSLLQWLPLVLERRLK